MKPCYDTELLHVLWNLYPRREYLSRDGRRVTVHQQGEYDENRSRYCGARIEVDGQMHLGEIVIWAGDEAPAGNFESTVLHVSPADSAGIMRNDGQPVLHVVDAPDPVLSRLYGNMRGKASPADCPAQVAAMQQHERVALFTRLMADRLYDKFRDIMQVYEHCEQNWTETTYFMLLRTMGSPYNKEPFSQLASRVGYKQICKEKSSIQNIEALLLGTSGLLDKYPDDSYLRSLKDTFTHYCRKYGIVPLRAGQWDSRGHSGGSPVIRLAQLAALFMKRDTLHEPLLKCTTVQDVQRYFDVDASMYWSTHYRPGEATDHRTKHLGADKANMMGINFIAPMQFAYGVYIGDESLKEGAIELIEKIGAENNRIISLWRAGGVLPESAFDTQALLQINKQYCSGKLCWKCPVGKRVVKEAYGAQSAQKM